jgi:hypothetical protein
MQLASGLDGRFSILVMEMLAKPQTAKREQDEARVSDEQVIDRRHFRQWL